VTPGREKALASVSGQQQLSGCSHHNLRDPREHASWPRIPMPTNYEIGSVRTATLPGQTADRAVMDAECPGDGSARLALGQAIPGFPLLVVGQLRLTPHVQAAFARLDAALIGTP
jgi:hypothetical protein